MEQDLEKLEIAILHVKKNMFEHTTQDDPELYAKLKYHYENIGRAQKAIMQANHQIQMFNEQIKTADIEHNQNLGAAGAIENILAEEFLKKNPNPEPINLVDIMKKIKNEKKENNQ